MSLIDYQLEDSIAVITLDRPEAMNAQTPAFLDELDAMWTRAAEDPAARVIVLRAEGKHFSAGHDLNVDGEELGISWRDGAGIGPAYDWELREYFGYCDRWRNVPKPSIAAVQGACIAAGLMLCWPCDLILAADDAYFTDPVMLMGMPGVEYHGHTWEWGPRKAKEMLFTAKKMGADEALALGAVNRVVPRDELRGSTLELAREIAAMNPYALALAKRAVNVTMDAAGQGAAMRHVYDIHWLGHSNALVSSDNESAVLTDLQGMKEANRGSRSAKS